VLIVNNYKKNETLPKYSFTHIYILTIRKSKMIEKRGQKNRHPYITKKNQRANVII
jgi:hypothetical protein